MISELTQAFLTLCAQVMLAGGTGEGVDLSAVYDEFTSDRFPDYEQYVQWRVERLSAGQMTTQTIERKQYPRALKGRRTMYVAMVPAGTQLRPGEPLPQGTACYSIGPYSNGLQRAVA